VVIRTLAGSVCVHVGVIAAITTAGAPAARRPPSDVPPLRTVTIDVTPAPVTPAPEAPVAPAAPVAAAVAEPAPRRRPLPERAAAGADHAAPPAPVPAPLPAVKSDWLALRRPAQAAAAVPRPEAVAAAAAAPREAVPPALLPPPTRAPTESHRDDGSVLPCLHCVGRELYDDVVAWLRDPYEYTRALADAPADDGTLGKPTMRALPPSAGAAPDSERPRHMIYIPHMRARHDILGGGAAAPKRLAVVADPTAKLPVAAQLAAVWRRSALSETARRRLLFLLWDECAEDDDAGARARATIEAWIRAQLPHGSVSAFDDAELSALNRARTSHAPFQPYEAGRP
jgi:hypothetical protein